MADETVERHEHDRKLRVTVKAPRSPEPKKFVWDDEKLVGQAAAEAAAAFGYTGGTASLVHRGEALDSELSLEAAGVHNGEHLELLDTGGGV
jgi:hypothetical protein